MLDKAVAYLHNIADLLQPRKRRRVVDNDIVANGDWITKPRMQVDSHFDLLSLPDSGLMKIIKFLDPEDRRTLFEASKACAKVVMNYYADRKPLAQCRIDQSTTWEGLRQVLSWIDTPLRLVFRHSHQECKRISAYDVFMGSPSIPSSMQQAICDKWKFACVREVDVVGCKLRSLVPRVIAATCPNMQYCRTSVLGFAFSYGIPYIQGLHPCHSLKTLVIDDPKHDVLPLFTSMHHHTAQDLIVAFPNVSEMHLPGGFPPFFLQAFSQQVSVLRVSLASVEEAALLHAYSKLRSLNLDGSLVIDNLLPLPAVTEHLHTLQLICSEITDSMFEQLLQLPNLERLAVGRFNLQQDCSSRTFKQKIKLELYWRDQELCEFAKLPMNSFTQCWLYNPHQKLRLPDPSQPDSFATVHEIAKQVADAHLKIFVHKRLKWVVPETAHDADAAAIFSVAAPIICMRGYEYDLGAITNRPAFLAAVIDWASPTVDRVRILITPEASEPYIWQMLQKMPKLNYVILTADSNDSQTVSKEELLAQVCDVICSAAKYVVQPAFMPGELLTFRIELCTPDYDDEAACNRHIMKMYEIMDNSLPDLVLAEHCRVYDSEWKLILVKLGSGSDVCVKHKHPKCGLCREM